MHPSPSDAYPKYKPQRAAMSMPHATVPNGYGYSQYAAPHANTYYATTMTIGDHTTYTPYEPLRPPGYRRPSLRPSHRTSPVYSSGSYSPTSPTTFPSYEKEAKRHQDSVSTWERIRNTITRRNSNSSSSPTHPRVREAEPPNGIFIPPPLEARDSQDPSRRNEVHPSLRPRPVRDRTQSFDTHNATYATSERAPQHGYDYRSTSYSRDIERPESRGSRPGSRGPSSSKDREYLREYRRSTGVGDPDALQADGYGLSNGKRMRTNSNASRVSHVSQASHASQAARIQSRSSSAERRGQTSEPKQTSKPAQAQAPLKGILRRTTNDDRQRAESQSRSRYRSDSDARPFQPSSPPSPSSPTTVVKLGSAPRLRPPRGSREAYEVHRLLSKGSSNLLHYDLRLPPVLAKKAVSGSHLTPLNHEDNWDPATEPPLEHLRIFCDLLSDSCIDVFPNKRGSGTAPKPGSSYDATQSFVTVADVLKALSRMFSTQVDLQKFVLDAADPEIDERLRRSSKRRYSMLKARQPGDETDYKEAKAKGYLMVDYLGSKYIYAGLTFAWDDTMTPWLVLETKRDSK